MKLRNQSCQLILGHYNVLVLYAPDWDLSCYVHLKRLLLSVK